MTEPASSRLPGRVTGFFSNRAVVHSAGAAASQFIAQGIRFGTNVVLASLLSPAIFGLLAIVTAVRTGIELLSDIGINQSIIVSRNGERQGFVETAWALQILRGLVLAAIGAAAAYPLAALYGENELGLLLMVGSIGSIISGLGRPGPALLQRNREIGWLIVQRVGVAATASASTLAVTSMMPSALGVVIGGLVGGVCAVCISFLVKPLPGYIPRLRKRYRSQIVHFGKWIFVATAIYFFAQNFDRLYLPAMIPLAVFGIYNLSRSIADVVVQTVAQINGMVVLPAIARSADTLDHKRAKLGGTRFAGLSLVALGLGGLIALADLIILTIFDDRYALGATILPVLLAGSWFTIHASTNESVLMGLGRTKTIAAGNMVRLASAVIGLPLAFMLGGLAAGLVAIAFADILRYVWLMGAARKVKMSFARQDAALLLIMLGAAVLVREMLVLLGLVDGFVSSVQLAGFAELRQTAPPTGL